jgi:hypothetical protein
VLFRSTSSSGYGVWAQSTTGQAFYAQSPYSDGVAAFIAHPSSTNTVHTILNLSRISTSAGANGIGGAVDFNINNSNAPGTATKATRLISKLTTATSGAEVSQFEIWGVNTSLARKAALSGLGQWTWDGYPALTAQVDTATYKPVAIDGSGNVVKMAGWSGSGGGATPGLQSVITANPALTTDNTITSNSTFRINQTYSGGSTGTFVFDNDDEFAEFSMSKSGDNYKVFLDPTNGSMYFKYDGTTGDGVTQFALSNNNTFGLQSISDNTVQHQSSVNGDTLKVELSSGKLSPVINNNRAIVYNDSIVLKHDSAAINKTLSVYLKELPELGTQTNRQVVAATDGKLYAKTPLTYAATATGSVVANDNELTLIGSGVGSLVIPANTLTAGKTYRVTARGKYSTDASNPAQMNWRLKLGSTTIAATGNAGLGTNKVDKNYDIHFEFTCRTTGASGSVMAQGMFFTEDGPGANGAENSFAATTIDTTTSNTVDFTVDLTDGSAGNSCYCYIFIFEEVN